MIELLQGDCRESLQLMIDMGQQVDSVVTDPPYGLTSITKRFGNGQAAAKTEGNDGSFSRMSGGFMNQTWDGSGIERDVSFWKLIYDVLKDGAYVLAFSSPRTGHRQACAMEDAGFIMHPFIGWMYGSGFPKQHRADTAIVKSTGDIPASAQWVGWGYGTQALKPALEPIYFAQKPPRKQNMIRNLMEQGVGAINIDGCRVPEGQKHPSNLVHDGSEDLESCFPHDKAAGFFNSFPIYHPKANKADRAGSKHPTVKPVALMQWLCRLITPAGGIVLDPFAGTGTTAEAAEREGLDVILMEANPDYCRDIESRFAGKLISL